MPARGKRKVIIRGKKEGQHNLEDKRKGRAREISQKNAAPVCRAGKGGGSRPGNNEKAGNRQ